MKKRIIAAFLAFAMMAGYIFTTPLGLSVSAADSSATEYTYSTEKIGLSMYHFPMWANTNDADKDGEISWEEYQAEIVPILDAGYVNTLYLNLNLHFSEVLNLIKTNYQDQKFWILPGNFDSSSQTIDVYLDNVGYYVGVIKNAGLWDNFLGFHWDEPFQNGMTDADFLTMTEALYKSYLKRINPVFTSSNAQSRITTEILKYVTDIGFDNYAKGDDVSWYRSTTNTMLSKVDHPVNLWYYSCAFYDWSGGQNQSYAQEQLQMFSELLDEYAGHEKARMGGISLYTYRTWDDNALDKYLPESVVKGSSTWSDLAGDIKDLTAAYDDTSDNEVYTGIKYNPFASGLNDTASYFMNVYDDTTAHSTTTGANIGWASFLQGGNSLPITKENNETFIVLDTTEDVGSDKGNTRIYFNSFFDGYTKDTAGLLEGIDQENLTYFAMRIKLDAASAGVTSNLHIAFDRGSTSGDYETNLNNVMLIDKSTGKVTKPSWSGSTFKFDSDAFDGWVLVPFTAWNKVPIYSDGKFDSTISGIRYILSDASSGWQADGLDRKLYVGDIFVVEDADAFASVHGAPEISVTSDKNSITATSSASGVVYSLDGVTYNNTTGVFTGLESEKSYTVYAKYENGTHVTTVTVFTKGSPYSSGLGDSASYFMNVYDDNSAHPNSTSANNGGVNNINAQGGGLPIVKDENGETFLKFLVSRVTSDYPNVNVFFNSFFDGYDKNTTGLRSEIDQTNLTHFAFRVKVDAGTEGAADTFHIAMQKKYTLSGHSNEDPYGPDEQDLSGAYLIDKATGAVIDPEWTGTGFTFGSEAFDGWIVVPFNAWDVEGDWKDFSASRVFTDFSILEDGVVDSNLIRMKYKFEKQENWLSRNVYIGDAFVIESTDAFNAVHGSPQFTLSATRDTITATYSGSSVVYYSLDGKDFSNTTGIFTGLAENTDYTVYAKYANGNFVAQQTVRTKSNPYSTGLGDTGSYMMNVYDDISTYPNTTNANNGWISNMTQVADYKLPIVEDDNGETFIKFTSKSSTADASVHIFFNSFFEGYDKNTTGLMAEIDQTNLTHFAFRVKVDAAASETASDVLNIYMQKKQASGDPTGERESNLEDAYLIDMDGNVIDPNWTGGGFTFGADAFDGWIVVPFTAWDKASNGFSVLDADGNIDSSLIRMKYFLLGSNNMAGSDWNGRGFYVGDALVIESTDAFNAVHSAPEFTLSATKNTIIADTSDSDVLYSIDGVDFSNTTGVFTELNSGTSYTVYAKYPNGIVVSSKTISTEAGGKYDSPYDDTGSYLMNVYDDISTYPNTTSANNGWASYLTNLGDYKLPIVKDDNGESFIKLASTTSTADANVHIFFNSFFEGYDKNTTGLMAEIDQTNLTHFAFRVKVDAAASETASDVLNIYMQKKQASGDPTGERESNLEDAYLIDMDGNVIDPNWTGGGFTFGADAFDGWIVVPFTAWDKASNGFSVLDADGNIDSSLIRMKYFLLGSNNMAGSDWNGRGFYVGDAFVIEDAEVFNSVHGKPVINATADANSITIEAHANIEYSISASDEWLKGDNEVVFTNLKAGKTYTVYARNILNGLYATTTISTASSNPYASGLHDTASYLMNIYDDDSTTTKNGINTATANSITSGTAGAQSLPIVKDEDGETFLVLDCKSSKTDGNIKVWFNSFFNDDWKKQGGLMSEIDQTNLTHFAFRVKLDAGTAGTTSYFNIYMHMILPEFVDPEGVHETHLEDAYLIDQNGNVIDPNWTGGGFEFGADAFDGWIVVPFEAWDNTSFNDNAGFYIRDDEGKVDSRLVRMYYYLENSNNEWLERNLYIGDAFVIEDTNAFNAAHGVEDLTIDKVSLTLEQNVALNFKANAQALADYTNIQAHVTFGDVVEVIDAELNGDDYVFTFKNVGAEYMGDKISVYLTATKDGVEYKGAGTQYSIADYCYNKLAQHRLSTDKDELKALVVNLLNYGSAVQTYVDYNADDLVNADLLNSEKALVATEVPDMDGIRAIYNELDSSSEKATWVSAGLSFQYNVQLKLRFKINAGENLANYKLVITDEDGNTIETITSENFVNGSGNYVAYFGGLNATEMNKNILVTVYNGSTQVSDTLAYAISAYARQKYTGDANDNLSNVVLEMMRYGDAAVAYAPVASNS